jgi:hypothetical protein
MEKIFIRAFKLTIYTNQKIKPNIDSVVSRWTRRLVLLRISTRQFTR